MAGSILEQRRWRRTKNSEHYSGREDIESWNYATTATRTRKETSCMKKSGTPSPSSLSNSDSCGTSTSSAALFLCPLPIHIFVQTGEVDDQPAEKEHNGKKSCDKREKQWKSP